MEEVDTGKTLAVFHKKISLRGRYAPAEKNAFLEFANFFGKKKGVVIFCFCFRNTVAKALRSRRRAVEKAVQMG